MTVTSWPFSSSSRARFQPTLPAPAMMTYSPAIRPTRLASAARSSWSIAICVGQIVCRPCSAYQAARRGSSTRAITRGTSKRRWAIWETTRLVLSPFVEAMKTSRLLDAGLHQRVHLERGADREAPAGLLPALPELDVEALVRERVLVEHGHGVAGAQRRRGDGGADAAGADDEDEHRRGL